MNKNHLILAFLWILSLAGTYWLARDTHTLQDYSSGSDIVIQPTPDGSPPKPLQWSPEQSKSRTPLEDQEVENQNRAASFEELLSVALRNDDALARNLQVAELLANLNAGNLEAALAKGLRKRLL